MRLPTRELSAEQTAFRRAMAAFPSGVTIVTTSDADGRWWGFTASSFCSVSLSPPLVLVCLDRNADCHAAFSGVSRWAIHLVPPDHIDLARRFATRGADKFAGDWFVADGDGLPILDRAAVTLRCTVHAIHPGGDHSILVGRVLSTHLEDKAAALYYRRDLRSLPEGW